MTALRVYRWLLAAYPRAFRARFEPGLIGTFAADYARVRRAGRLVVLSFWLRTVGEAIAFGAAERFVYQNRPSWSSLARKGHLMRSGLLTDARDAWRSLRTTPLVSLVAVLSLALGIGANTALFSIFNGLVLKALPVRAPEELVLLEEESGPTSWTNPIWEAVRARQHEVFAGAFAWSNERFNLAPAGPTDFVTGGYVSGGMFDVMGVHAWRGRLLSPADDVSGGGPDGAIVVIGHEFWRARFGGADDAIGRSLVVNGVPFKIAGVTPPGFFGPQVGDRLDVMVPLAGEALVRGRESLLPGRSTWWMNIMARLKPGQTLDAATSALRAAQPQIRAATIPPSFTGPMAARYLSTPFALTSAAHGRSTLRTRYLQPLTIVLAVVAAVLLIACANIASLQLARAAARRQELVVRLALGASRWRLSRQLIIESLTLAGIGAALGLAVARAGSALLIRQLATPGGVVSLDVTVDARVLAFTTAVAVVTALLFGLAPAVGVAGVAPNEVLREHTRSVTGDRRWSLRNALVVMQVALSLALVVAAGLFVRTFALLVTQPLGFDASPLVAVELNVQQSPVPPEGRAALFSAFRAAALATPGVANAAISDIRPVSGAGWNARLIQPPDAPALSDQQRTIWINAISPEFFATYGMTLVAGRDFTNADRVGAPLVTVVNEMFARRFFNGANPVGREFRVGEPFDTEVYQIVGLVSDAVYRRPREGVLPTTYRALSQQATLNAAKTLAVRAAPRARATLMPALARTLSAVDPRASLTVRPFDDYLDAAVVQERLIAWLSGVFGALALILAGLGVFGVTSYGVNRRRGEIGVRLALGADRGRIVRLVLARVTLLISLGVVSGVALAWWAAQYIQASLLYGVTTRDWTTLSSAALVLAAVGALAGALPALRASRIDPNEVLREG